MRSLSKLIPGVHPKLPDGGQAQVKRIYEHAEEHHEELNLYITGEEEIEPEPDEEDLSGQPAEGAGEKSDAADEGAAGESAGPPDDEAGGSATPSEAPAVGGGRQHMDKVTEGGTTAASGEATGGATEEDPEGADPDAGEGAGAGEEMAGQGDPEAGEAEGDVGAEDETKPEEEEGS